MKGTKDIIKKCKYILIALIIGFIDSSCKKSLILQKEYFIFGQLFNSCSGDCVQYYLITDSKLFPDADLKYQAKRLKFKRKNLSDEKFAMAKKLEDSFPEYLVANPNSTIGEPDARDQGKIYIEIKKRGKKAVKWAIDRDTSVLPIEIKSYITDMNNTLIKIKQ